MHYGPMGPYSLSQLSGGAKDGVHKQSAGTHNTKVNFPSPTPGTANFMNTDHSRGGFMAPSKVKGMVIAAIPADARDSGFPLMAHTGKN